MKTKNYSIRLTEQMMDYIQKQAAQKNMLPSEYIRLLIIKDQEDKSNG